MQQSRWPGGEEAEDPLALEGSVSCWDVCRGVLAGWLMLESGAQDKVRTGDKDLRVIHTKVMKVSRESGQ